MTGIDKNEKIEALRRHQSILRDFITNELEKKEIDVDFIRKLLDGNEEINRIINARQEFKTVLFSIRTTIISDIERTKKLIKNELKNAIIQCINNIEKNIKKET